MKKAFQSLKLITMARNGLPTDCLILSQRSGVLPDVHKIIPMFYGFQFGIFKQLSLSLIFFDFATQRLIQKFWFIIITLLWLFRGANEHGVKNGIRKDKVKDGS